VTNLKTNKDTVVVGLGFVGLTLAVAFSRVGVKVHGVESDPHRLESIRKGDAPFFEPGLDEALKIALSNGTIQLHNNCNWLSEDRSPKKIVITVGTPLIDIGSSKSTFDACLEELADVLISGDLLITRSTVSVGTNRISIPNILGKKSELIGIASCPERTVEGNALEELRELPQIVAGRSENDTLEAAELFSTLSPKIITVTSLETAELLKLLSNSYRDTTFALSNEYATMCDLAEVSFSELKTAASEGYSRFNIGKPGPVGGPCLEKDAYLLEKSFGNKQYLPEITMAGRATNESLIPRIVRMLKPSKLNPSILIAGLAFKGIPSTDDLRGSTIFQLLKEVQTVFPGSHLRIWDPVIKSSKFSHAEYTWYSREDTEFKADICIVHNNNEHFKSKDFRVLLESCLHPNGILVDLASSGYFEETPYAVLSPGDMTL